MDHSKKLQEEFSSKEVNLYTEDVVYPIKSVTVDTWNYILPLFFSLMLTLKLSLLSLVDGTTGSNSRSKELVSLHSKTSEHNSYIPEKFLEGFHELPQELLAQIFSELSASDISNVSSTCRRFNSIIKNYRRQLPLRTLDSLEISYSANGDAEFFQSGSINALGMLAGERKKKYMGENRFDILQYRFIQVSCSLESVDEKLIQILRIDRVQANRIDFRLKFAENDAAISLIKRVIAHIQTNPSIRKAVFRTSKPMTEVRNTLKEATQNPDNKLIVY